MGNKVSKSERVSVITKTLVENPMRLYTLQYFKSVFDVAKSTLSEDIGGIEKMLEEEGDGKIISVPGAAGGIFYQPFYSEEKIKEVKNEIQSTLMDKSRAMTGGFVYLNDIFYNPTILNEISKCILSQFHTEEIDYVVTIETKGIPLATMIAKMCNKPLAVVRKSARLSEGPMIQLNYVTNSTGSIKTMSMPIRSLKRGAKILFVDDFMRAGGTAKGVIELMQEFDASVEGIAVVFSTKEPKKKLVEKYYTMFEYESHVNEDGTTEFYMRQEE